jgi:hypothetical protein
MSATRSPIDGPNPKLTISTNPNPYRFKMFKFFTILQNISLKSLDPFISAYGGDRQVLNADLNR